ncbi:unnamed protein product [Mytilus coruscus]|uniref:Mutator-like transposase domain-containing protein n=1 Tax=Mytilus coruscus TaxID=42192 RepID=A0A6J8BC51_MYTCO|nr:unnamed protein product [Mytilus coruscus]
MGKTREGLKRYYYSNKDVADDEREGAVKQPHNDHNYKKIYNEPGIIVEGGLVIEEGILSAREEPWETYRRVGCAGKCTVKMQQIPCSNLVCKFINHVLTGKRHNIIWDANTQLASAMRHAGIGERQVNSLLSELNILHVSTWTLKARQNEAGHAFNSVTEECMVDAAKEEVQLNARDDGLCVSVDGTWQKRDSGRGYDSLSGHCTMIGTVSGEVLGLSVRSKVCDIAKSKKANPKPHTCNINWEGSSKAMEQDMVIEMVPNQEKAGNSNQGKEEGISQGFDAISRHPFGDHSLCNPNWCSHVEDPLKNEKYATLGSTQANESLNKTIASKAPKAHFYSGISSLHHRVAAGQQEDWHVTWTIYHEIGHFTEYPGKEEQAIDVATAKKAKIRRLELKARSTDFSHHTDGSSIWGKKWSTYIFPKQPISKSDITGISISGNRMYHHGKEVTSSSVSCAVEGFLSFIQQVPRPVFFAGHTIKVFDCPLLFNALEKKIGFGQMGVASSPCYRCRTVCSPNSILPRRRLEGRRSRNVHSCLCRNCFNRADGPIVEETCVHPRSLHRRVVYASQQHLSTGSTVETFLTQDDLASQVSDFEPTLSDIDE